MINVKTGAISLETINFVINPAFTREEFLSSPLAAVSRVSVRNEPRCCFITKAQEIAGHLFIITLFFYGSALTNVELCADDNRFGTSWDDWSEEKELQRKRFHESWLKKVLGGAPDDHKWGTVESVFDAKGGSSSVIIKYRKLNG